MQREEEGKEGGELELNFPSSSTVKTSSLNVTTFHPLPALI